MNAETSRSPKLHYIVPSRPATTGFTGINEEADAVVIASIEAIVMRDGFRYARLAIEDTIKGDLDAHLTVVAYARHTTDTSADLGAGQRGLFFLVRHQDDYAVLGSGTGFMRFVG